MKALVILSGGQDSTTALYMAKNDPNCAELHTITFDYGQRHRREIESAHNVASMAKVDTSELIHVRELLRSTSPLVDHGKQLEQYDSAEEMDKIIGDRVELTFVPMRNALFLTIAANRAVARGCDTIVIGVCQDDNANYPDCRQGFIYSQQNTINEALGEQAIAIWAPLLHLPKPQAIKRALLFPGCYTALAYTHTAYDGSYPPSGKDHATVLRAAAFKTAGAPDPLIVRAWLMGDLATLPPTANYVDHDTVLLALRKDFDGKYITVPSAIGALCLYLIRVGAAHA